MSADEDSQPGLGRRQVLMGSALLGAAAAGPSAALAQADRPYDVVIVGGGSAGAVLACRLSEEPARKVLLIEAGKAYAPERYPDAVRLQAIIGGDADHDWGYRSEPFWGGGTLPLPRGKVLGGCSAINAAVAMRAPATDFERWTATGLRGWTPADVLPFYRRSERATNGDDRLRGRNGPWPIHQLDEGELSEMQRAFVASCRAAGHARALDFNGETASGVGPYPMNVRAGNRLNTGMTYLSAEVRARRNLTILAEALVDRVEIDGKQAVAVRLADGRRIAGGRVVLSAGSYNSPTILLRSGIGPAPELAALGIPLVADLPVGRGLQEHPFYQMAFAARPERLGLPFPLVGAALVARSQRPTGNEYDLHVSAVHYGEPKDSPTGAIFKLAIANLRPAARGAVTLRGRDPHMAPRIQLNLLGEQIDRDRLVDGVELVRRIAATAPLRDMIAFELAPGAAAVDRAWIERALPAAMLRFNHPTSTVRMGRQDDPGSVVDAEGRVHGISRLQVIDASIFPDMPACPIHPTVLMAAEKLAGSISRG